MRILITGASGFVGSHLLDALRGQHELSVLVHRTRPSGEGFSVLRGDLSTGRFESRKTHRFDVLYHLAAATPLTRNKKHARKLNCEGTQYLLKQLKGKVGRVVYVSGLGAFGDTKGEWFDERAALRPNTDYTKARVEIEQWLRDACAKAAMDLNVAYLGEIYGSAGWFVPRMLRMMRLRLFGIPQRGEYYRSWMHVHDAAAALKAIGTQAPPNTSFILADAEPLVFRELVWGTCDRLGVWRSPTLPNFMATMACGGEFLKLLSSSTRASNKKIAKLIDLKYPNYWQGLEAVLKDLNWAQR